MNKHNQFDQFLYALHVNLFTLSKETGNIYLNNFNPKNPEHKFFFKATQEMATIFNREIYVDMSRFKFFFFKLKTRDRRLHRGVNEKGINIEDVLNFMKEAYDLESDYFTKIGDN